MGKPSLSKNFIFAVISVLLVASGARAASLGVTIEEVDQIINGAMLKLDFIDASARSQNIQRDEKNIIPTAYDKYMDYFTHAQMPPQCKVVPSYTYKSETVHETNGFSGKEIVTRKYLLQLSDGKNNYHLEMIGNYWSSRVSTVINGHSVSKFLMPVDVVINSANGTKSQHDSFDKPGFALTWIVDEDYVVHSLRLQVFKPGETASLKSSATAVLGDMINCHD